MNNDVTAKIKMLQESMQCFAFGLIGLLPVIGLPFALAALWIGGKARIREKRYWNAAKPYRILGVVCASVATILWFLVGAVIALNSVSNQF